MNEATDRLDLHPLDLRRIPRDLPSSEYKLGDEFKPFHPSASHVPPDYRDGWNRCWLAASQAWQPIETAPKDGTVIDLWIDGERVADCRWQGGWLTQDDGCDWAVGEPSHWMPRPRPPTSGK